MMAKAHLRSCIRPQPVFCVIEHAYRNREVAEEVCAGRFTHIGITLELGVEPNWFAENLTTDEEWRIQWTKFYYGLDLANAFCETGDQRFLQTWERLVSSWIQTAPIGYGTSDVAGRRIQNWIYAWNLFASSPAFTGLAGGLEEQLIKSITCQANHLWHHLTPERNHRTLELYALFIAALALPQIDRDGSLLGFAIDSLHQNLMTDIRPDGVHRESSTHYHMTALRSFLGARENARRSGIALPDGYDERLERACEFAMHCHRPDGSIPALSDSDTGSYADILELAASIFSRPDFLYAASAGAKGVPPQALYKSFPAGGYFMQRSGWGDGKVPFSAERFLIFDCGPLGDGGHGHYDLLNVEIAAHGRPLVVDPGRYTYSEQGENWRRWFKSTAAHNTVTIDGCDQTRYRRGKPKEEIAQGRLIERLSAPDFDVLAGEALSPLYEVIHTRRIFFIAGQYWIIADQLRGDRPHRFDLRFHLAPEAQGQVAIEACDDNLVARTPRFALVFDGARELNVEPGWYAPVYGARIPAPVIRVTANGVSQADFYTLVVPLKANRPTPTLQVRSSHSTPNRSITFAISHAGPDGTLTDLVCWSGSGETLELGGFECRASAAWLRKSAARAGLRASNVREVARPSEMPEPLFMSDEPAGWIMWDAQRGLTLDDGRAL